MDIVSLILEAVIIVLLVVLIFRRAKGDGGSGGLADEMRRELEGSRRELREALSETKRELSSEMKNSISFMSEQLVKNQTGLSGAQNEQIRSLGASQLEQITLMQKSIESRLSDMHRNVTALLVQLEARLESIEKSTETKLQGIRMTVDTQLSGIREDNTKQLELIRGTVDEKLQSTLERKMNESFRLVSERLEQVYKGLGEMQNVAKGVGDLKKVLSNVKTRGILGEVQLGAILKEILTPDQYDENVATVPHSKNRVEFAVKLPGTDEGRCVYLPIDSKFNGDAFGHLQDAYESGEKELIGQCRKELADAVRKCAKDISDKYIKPPETTQFAVMFLPVEGLYAEVVNMPGLVEELQRTYKINIAGPSTMAAMLNSLRMGFQTLAVQRRSNEVWGVLADVKTEFEKFAKVLRKAQEHLRLTESDLDTLIGTRTNMMNKALGKFERLEDIAGSTAVKNE